MKTSLMIVVYSTRICPYYGHFVTSYLYAMISCKNKLARKRNSLRTTTNNNKVKEE